jgi:hypothetical protein
VERASISVATYFDLAPFAPWFVETFCFRVYEIL